MFVWATRCEEEIDPWRECRREGRFLKFVSTCKLWGLEHSVDEESALNSINKINKNQVAFGRFARKYENEE